MKKIILAVMAVAVLSLIIACGSGGGGSSETSNTNVECNSTMNISNQTFSIEAITDCNITVNGSSNDITIKSNNKINTCTNTGSNSTVTVEQGATIEKLVIDGDNNTFDAPAGSITVIEDNGTGNIVNFN